MVSKAGGEDVLGRLREPSVRVTSDDIMQAMPDVIVAMPCGYDAARTTAEFRLDQLPAGSERLPAVRERRVFAVDANAYFSRPGPQLADGVALLAHLLHPGLFSPGLLAGSFRRLL
jgi:iron complex transport system substrate-binding protein